jgi:hypothetical protein
VRAASAVVRRGPGSKTGTLGHPEGHGHSGRELAVAATPASPRFPALICAATLDGEVHCLAASARSEETRMPDHSGDVVCRLLCRSDLRARSDSVRETNLALRSTSVDEKCRRRSPDHGQGRTSLLSEERQHSAHIDASWGH